MIWLNPIWNIAIIFNLELNISVCSISSGNLFNFLDTLFDIYSFWFWLEFIFWNGVYLLEILDPIPHLFEFKQAFIINCFARIWDVLIQSPQYLFCNSDMIFNLFHQCISNFGHFFFGFHNLLIHHNWCYISNDKKLISPSCYTHIYLI